jgi:class 3 adenylate cyclase
VSAAADAMDLDFDLRGARRRRVRRFLRVAVPVVTLLILLACIAGIGTYLHKANRADARILTDDLLQELGGRIVAEVVAFLEPAATMVRLAEEALGDEALVERRDGLVEPLSIHILESNPHLATINFADPQGSFLMVRRLPDGAVHTKFMDRRGEGVETTWVRRDASGRITSTESDPADTYDPRTRPWYRGAVSSGELYWSDVYVFFTDKHPGITASLPVFDDMGKISAVYAIDIALEELSAFLGGLTIGRNGRALIIDERGVLVAYPDLDRMLKETEQGIERAHIEELGDPVLNRALDRYRVDGPGARELHVGDDRYINTATSLKPTLGRDWTLLIVAPEDDFVGFVADNNRRGLYMAVAVLALASVLTGLLVFQGLRADRNAQLVSQRSAQLEAQSHAFSGLAAQAAFFDTEDDSSVAALTETVAGVVGARRVSVWQLSEDGTRLVCDDAFDKDTGGHTGGTTFGADQLPQYFQSLGEGEEIVAMDAADDPRTAELHRTYLHPLDCRILSSIPVVREGDVLGVLWLEDTASAPDQVSEDLRFARAVANLLALRMRRTGNDDVSRLKVGSSSGEKQRSAAIADSMRETDLATGRRAAALRARIAREHGEGAKVQAQVFEDVSVVVIRFTNPLTLAASVDGSGGSALDNLVYELESLASDEDAEYLKMLGNEIVCAAGFSGESRQGAQAMAGFAVGALDYCARLFTGLERPLEFRIGLDSGPVIGSAVGRDRSVFNLWGEAVLTASRMAETGVAGHVQATESAYLRLRDEFLFRLRGSYYLEGFGELTTYFLTGRL